MASSSVAAVILIVETVDLAGRTVDITVQNIGASGPEARIYHCRCTCNINYKRNYKKRKAFYFFTKSGMKDLHNSMMEYVESVTWQLL